MTGSDDARPAASEPRVPDAIDALVVPLDGSGFSLTALPAATRLAARLGAEVHLLSAVESVEQVDARDRELARMEVPGHVVHRTVVVDRDPAGAIHEAVRKLQNAVACMATHRRRFGPDGDAEGYLATLVEPFRADRHQVEPVVRYDPASVWGGLYRYLNDHPAALVATNTRSWAGVRRLVLGSVAATIVRHSPSPALVVPRPDGATRHER
ncbi:MAG: universal stress protein [Acidimicrobiales bacterium]